MLWEQTVQYASMSDIGLRRRNNQDSFAVHVCTQPEEWQQYGHLFLVADGMGGHAVGELASKIAADSLPHSYYKDNNTDREQALKESIESANRAINERGTLNREFANMGTTCSTLVLGPSGALIGHVGDSRVYRIRHQTIEQLTFDHSLQWELMRLGRMSPEEIMLNQPRNVITRSLGPEAHVEVDLEGPHPVYAGDTFVLCSDGLTGHVSDSEIGTIAGELPPAQACRLLVNLANLRGGSDNITVVIARVQSSGNDAVAPRVETPPSGFEVSWTMLLFVWTLAAMFVAGLSMAMLDRYISGVALMALPLMIVLVMILRRWRREATDAPPQIKKEKSLEPYRRASARLTRRFVSDLAALQADLERSAIDEGWSVNWSEHKHAEETAHDSIKSKRYVDAVGAYAEMLDLLMLAIHAHRKHIQENR